MRILTAIALIGAITVGTPAVVASVPTPIAFEMTAMCSMRPRSWVLRSPGFIRNNVVARPERHRIYDCQRARGLKSPTREINVLLSSWPSEAQFRAWESPREGSFHADD